MEYGVSEQRSPCGGKKRLVNLELIDNDAQPIVVEMLRLLESSRQHGTSFSSSPVNGVKGGGVPAEVYLSWTGVYHLQFSTCAPHHPG